MLYGRLKSTGKWEEHSFRYGTEAWTAAEARSHCKAHDGTFEAASAGKGADCRCGAALTLEVSDWPGNLILELADDPEGARPLPYGRWL